MLKTTKEQVVAAANRKSLFDGGCYGGFVNTDGDWAAAHTPEKLAEVIRSLGFEVARAYETTYSSAIVETADGYMMTRNGYVSRINANR